MVGLRQTRELLIDGHLRPVALHRAPHALPVIASIHQRRDRPVGPCHAGAPGRRRPDLAIPRRRNGHAPLAWPSRRTSLLLRSRTLPTLLPSPTSHGRGARGRTSIGAPGSCGRSYFLAFLGSSAGFTYL